MKILTWNSAMKFREKIQYVLPFASDIMVIPECEAPEKWRDSKYKEDMEQFLWFGDNPNKGIGIFSFTEEYQLNLHPSYNDEFKYIIPLTVRGNENFILFAVWTQNFKQQYYSYIGQLSLALDYYKDLIERPCFIIGDWNSNKIFDHMKRAGTHTEVVSMLKGKDISSAYHSYFCEKQGEESIPTHYFRKEISSPFHLDYIFGSNKFIKNMLKLEVGSHQEWLQYSDHMPIIAEFK